MVKAILGDINIQGHLRILVTILEGEDWREFWSSLNLAVLTFQDVNLSQQTPDAVIWQTCQQEQLILVTANRNADGADSLEATLRIQNTAASLPVFTIADADRVLHSRDYAERVAVRLLDYLLEIDRVRGVGRLYLP
jgi:hypothetical protein